MQRRTSEIQMEWYHHFINYSGSQFYSEDFVNWKRTERERQKKNCIGTKWINDDANVCAQQSFKEEHLHAAASHRSFRFWAICGFEDGPLSSHVSGITDSSTEIKQILIVAVCLLNAFMIIKLQLVYTHTYRKIVDLGPDALSCNCPTDAI